MMEPYPSPLTRSLEAQLDRLYRRRKALDDLIDSLVVYQATDKKAPLRRLRPPQTVRHRAERRLAS